MKTNTTEKAAKVHLLRDKLKRSYVYTSELRNISGVLSSGKLSVGDVSRLVEKPVLPNKVKIAVRKEYNLPNHTEESDYDSEETLAND